MKKILIASLACAMLALPASADMKQTIQEKIVKGAEQIGTSTHSVLVKAKQIGFFVDEVRFEVSLTPKVEVFFRDGGDNGNFDSVISSANKFEESVLRSLQATRKFTVAHYTPTGVKLTTGAAKPVVEILTSFQE